MLTRLIELIKHLRGLKTMHRFGKQLDRIEKDLIILKKRKEGRSQLEDLYALMDQWDQESDQDYDQDLNQQETINLTKD
jgi:hypothetical protein